MTYTVTAIIVVWAVATVYLATLVHKCAQAKNELAERRANNDKILGYVTGLEALNKRRKKRGGVCNVLECHK